MNKLYFPLLTTIMMVVFCMRTNAQVDSINAMREFLDICRGYQRLPVQLDVEVKNSTNFQVSGSDTVAVEVEFRLDEDGLLIEDGDVEQEADPIHPATMKYRLWHMVDEPGDTDLVRLLSTYRVMKKRVAGDTVTIGVMTRGRLTGTDLSRTEIHIKYDEVSGQPFELVECKRSLVEVSDSIYGKMVGQPGWSGKIFSKPDGYYVVKEDVSTFRFVKLTHDSDGGILTI